MPVFSFKITIPANTPVDTPKVVTWKLEKCKIKRIRIRIPSGHVGLTGLQLWEEEKIKFPEREDQWFTGDHEIIDWEEEVLIDSMPYELIAKGYNLDTTYDHTFYVQFFFEYLKKCRKVMKISPYLSTQRRYGERSETSRQLAVLMMNGLEVN